MTGDAALASAVNRAVAPFNFALPHVGMTLLKPVLALDPMTDQVAALNNWPSYASRSLAMIVVQSVRFPYPGISINLQMKSMVSSLVHFFPREFPKGVLADRVC